MRTLTLAQAEQLLLTANPDIRAAQRALIGARADIERALALPNPQVGVDLFNSNSGNFGYRSQSQRIRIDQLIERGNKRVLRGDVATGATEAARVDVVDAVRQQRLSVHLAYWELASAQARLEIALGTVELLRRLSDAAERRVAASDLARVDLARLRVDAARVANEARAAAGDADVARVTLARLLGFAAAELPMAADPLPTDPDEMPPLTDAEHLLDARPDVRSARLRAAVAERQLELARAQRRRDVIVSGAAEHNGVAGGTTYSIGASVPLLVFYDFSGEIRRAQSDLEGARERLERTRAEATADIRRATAALAAAADRLRRARDVIVPGATEAAAGVEFAFSRGATGLTDLLDAQRVRAAARLDAVDAAADYAKARSAWLAALQWERNLQ